MEEQLSFYETGKILWKNMEVIKKAMVHVKEAGVEITKKLEKQEGKRF